MTKNVSRSFPLIVILGPTASGKSDLAVQLAKKFNGEIISADSRQVYRGLDIGSGKITRKEMREVPHYLLDVENPKKIFTVAQYQKLALQKIKQIRKRGKLPILVGGTGLYIKAVVDNVVFPEVKPNWKLRKRLEKKKANELFLLIKKIDPQRAKTIDRHNPRRLIRAIEIVTATGKPVPQQSFWYSAEYQNDLLIVGIKKSKEELVKLIQKRLKKRLKQGMVAEVKNLHRKGISWKRLEELGLEYRYIAQYIQKKVSYEQMLQLIQKESEKFAKRQMTWFKRDKRIHWVKPRTKSDHNKIFGLCDNFLRKSRSIS